MNKALLWFGLVLSGAIILYYIQKVTRRKMGLTTWDSKTDSIIEKLHPKFKDDARNFINDVEDKLGIQLRAYSGYRDYEEQSKLYAKGRTTEGKKVTNAPAGYSDHNFALAIDVVEIKDNKAIWNNPRWEEIAKIASKHGISWGGKWTSFKDKPHFYKRYGNSLAQLRALHSKKQGDYIKLA